MSGGNASLSGSATKREHYHAFLSHNGADKPLVEILAAELEKHGICCWLDKWNLIPGDPWPFAIEEALSCCDTCVVFFGPHGLGPWHNEEMWLALQRRVNSRERKLRVLPVILPSGQRAKESDLPGFLQGTTWVEFRQSIDEEDALHRLACGIKRIPPGRGPGATIAVGECPYLGLKTFQPEDAPLFFGRTAKVQELIDRLRNNFGTPKEERFLALIGASGSGKSSLALAGLIPSIQRGELPASAKWPLVRWRPGPRPWENLQIALSTNQQIALHTAAVRAVLKKLADARLVTTDRDDLPEAAQAELAHEALISGWRRLGEWVNENREKSRLKERLLDSGREWHKSSKKEDFLYRGAQLATAQEIFGSSEELPKIGREFLEASIAASKRAQRGRHWLLTAASAVFALLAAASAAAIFGFWQKGEAEKLAKLANDAKHLAEHQATLARTAEEETKKEGSQANVFLALNSNAIGNFNQEMAYLAKALRWNGRNSEAGALIGALLTQES